MRIAKGGTPLPLLYSVSRRRAQIENSSFILTYKSKKHPIWGAFANIVGF